MAASLKGTLALTPKGDRKLTAVLDSVMRTLRTRVPGEVGRARAVAAVNAPSPAVEAELLSKGQSDQGVVGTPDDGRFIKNGMVPVQVAIASDPVDLEETADRVVASTGRPSRINLRTGFSWQTRRRGEQGPTLPFNGNLVQALEDGGTWVVTPRPGTRSLEPQPNVFTQRVVKTLPPFRMYAQARAQRALPATLAIGEAVKRDVRKVGR